MALEVGLFDDRSSRSPRLQPKTAFWRFPPVHGVDLKRQQRVDLIRSPSWRRTTGICVRREKAALSSGCKPHPANAPAGSNRSSHGGDAMAEAFGIARHI